MSSTNYAIFDEKAIQLLRDISKEIEVNRKRKNLGVVGGSATGITGGGLSIAGAVLIPFTFGASIGLLIAGAVLGAAGAGMSIGFSLEKLFKDKKRVTIVKPALNEFIHIQRELAETFAILYVIYDVTVNEKYRETLTQDKVIAMKTFLGKMHSSYDKIHVNLREAIATIYKFTDDMTKLFEDQDDLQDQDERETETAISTDIEPLTANKLRKTLQQAKTTPFDMLDNALQQLYQDKTDSNKFTLLRLTKVLYLDDNFVDGTNSGSSIYVTAMTSMSFADGCSGGAAKLGTNVARIARGVTAAGIILSTFGVVVDLVFLGHAVCDLLDERKEEFSQSLTDAADIMESMNNCANMFSILDREKGPIKVDM